MPDFADQHETYRGNALPGMVDVLAGDLGVSRDALCRLGIGWKIPDSCWTFPERDADGNIIGILRRFLNGKKYCQSGSKRGLIYEPLPVKTGYDPNRQQWRRATEADPCPICGKPDWCGFDAASEPRFVRCMRVSEGSVHEDRSGGFIHELVEGSFRPLRSKDSPLPLSEYPVVVVEGPTDVAAALDLGLVAVGRSSAENVNYLAQILSGRDIIIIGENDAGAGVQGMKKAFEVLVDVAASSVKLLPPEGIKDLRVWVNRGLTREALLHAVEHGGDRSRDSYLFDSKAADYIAARWLAETQTLGKTCILCRSHREWLRFNGVCYTPLEEEAIRMTLYEFLEGKHVKRFAPNGECKIAPYEPTRAKVSDILDATLKTCYVVDDPPLWRDGRTAPEPKNVVVFQNGMLDAEAYAEDDADLLPLTPKFFSRTALPFAFKAGAKCHRWKLFLHQIFDGDAEKIALLQEWFGYNLVPDNGLSKFMLFVGHPGTGKSTVLDILQYVLGPGQYAFTSFKQLGSDFGLHPLVGKLAAIMPDAHLSRRTDAMQALEVLKEIVGGDTIAVNRKFLNTIDTQLSCRFTIATNELPRLPDNCRALERRLCLLDFLVSFIGREDVRLREKLRIEAPGIILWAIDGLKRLRQTGTFTAPKSTLRVIEDFSRILSPVIDFVEDCCELVPEAEVSTREVYDVWCRWASERGLAPNTDSVFGQRLLNQMLQVKRERHRLQGRRQYVYIGMRLTDAAVNQYLKPGG